MSTIYRPLGEPQMSRGFFEVLDERRDDGHARFWQTGLNEKRVIGGICGGQEALSS